MRVKISIFCEMSKQDPSSSINEQHVVVLKYFDGEFWQLSGPAVFFSVYSRKDETHKRSCT